MNKFRWKFSSFHDGYDRFFLSLTLLFPGVLLTVTVLPVLTTGLLEVAVLVSPSLLVLVMVGVLVSGEVIAERKLHITDKLICIHDALINA